VTRRGHIRGLCCVAAFTATFAPTLAVETVFWRGTAPAELAHGRPDGVSLGAQGSIALAPRLEPLSSSLKAEQAQPIVWCSALDKDRLFIGTGDGGRVLRIGPGEKAETLATLPEPHVTALTISRGGKLIAATSPQGAIYSITQEGEVEELFDPKERYIWSLAVGRDGTIYAGTGERGRIYTVDTDGNGKVFFDCDDPHIVSLAFDRQGRLLAGTQGNGLLIRFDGAAHPTVLLDTDQSEVSGLAVDGAGNIYASTFAESRREQAIPRQVTVRLGAASEIGGQEGPLPGPIPPIEMEGAKRAEERKGLTGVIEEAPAPSGAAGRPAPAGASRGTLIRMSPEGRVEEVWSSASEDIYALAAGADGALWFGTGSPASIRRLDRAGASVVLRLQEAEVTSLLLDRDGRLYATTSNAGSLYGIGPESSREGSYTSAPLDSRFLSDWGRVSWEAQIPEGARLEIQTRTGSSPAPDSAWSAWSVPYPDPSGSSIPSPPGRYLQWRARLTAGGRKGSASPVLRSLTLTSRPKNRPPRISEVIVPPADDAAAHEGGSHPAPAEDPPDSKHRLAYFSAEDPDGDPLTYKLTARPADSQGGQEVDVPVLGDGGPPLSWDDSKLQEGRWILTVSVSDEKSNPPGTELTAQSESALFEVDRTPPVLTLVTGEAPLRQRRIRASDTLSVIRSAEYSYDGKQWRAAAVADGILDSREEQILVPQEASGRAISFRVRDAAGNEARLDLPGSGSQTSHP